MKGRECRQIDLLDCAPDGVLVAVTPVHSIAQAQGGVRATDTSCCASNADVEGLDALWLGKVQQGEQALQRALRILEADPGASMHTLIETLIQMGDWLQILKAPREALPYYQRAWKLIHEAASLPSSASTALNVPVRVYYPTPDIVADVPKGRPEDAQAHHVQVEFTVAADGSVRDARIADHDTREQYAQEIFDAVRASRFRPKFIDGQAVEATGITYREVFWTDKPRD